MIKDNSYERNINMIGFFKTLKMKINKIILAGIITAIIVSGVKLLQYGDSMLNENKIDYSTKSDYLGTAKLYLGNNSTVNVVDAAKTYLISNGLLNALISDMNLSMDYHQLYEMIKIGDNSTSVVIINVTGNDKKLVQDITEYISVEGSTRLSEILGSTISIIDPASTSFRQYIVEVPVVQVDYISFAKKLIKYMAVGFIIGAVLLTAIYTTSYFISNKIYDENDVEGYLNIPVLGRISCISGTRKNVVKYRTSKKYRIL